MTTPATASKESLTFELERILRRDNLLRDPYFKGFPFFTGTQFSFPIPIDTLLSYPTFRACGVTTDDLLRASAKSSLLAVDFGNNTVTPDFQPRRTTVILREMPDDLQLGELLHLFAQCPALSIPEVETDNRPSKNTLVGGNGLDDTKLNTLASTAGAKSASSDSDVDTTDTPCASFALKSTGRIFEVAQDRDCWFVSVDTESAAEEFAIWLQGQTLRNERLKVRMKSTAGGNRSSTLPLYSGSMADPYTYRDDAYVSINPHGNGGDDMRSGFVVQTSEIVSDCNGFRCPPAAQPTGYGNKRSWSPHHGSPDFPHRPDHSSVNRRYGDYHQHANMHQVGATSENLRSLEMPQDSISAEGRHRSQGVKNTTSSTSSAENTIATTATAKSVVSESLREEKTPQGSASTSDKTLPKPTKPRSGTTARPMATAAVQTELQHDEIDFACTDDDPYHTTVLSTGGHSFPHTADATHLFPAGLSASANVSGVARTAPPSVHASPSATASKPGHSVSPIIHQSMSSPTANVPVSAGPVSDHSSQPWFSSHTAESVHRPIEDNLRHEYVMVPDYGRHTPEHHSNSQPTLDGSYDKQGMCASRCEANSIGADYWYPKHSPKADYVVTEEAPFTVHQPQDQYLSPYYSRTGVDPRGDVIYYCPYVQEQYHPRHHAQDEVYHVSSRHPPPHKQIYRGSFQRPPPSGYYRNYGAPERHEYSCAEESDTACEAGMRRRFYDSQNSHGYGRREQNPHYGNYRGTVTHHRRRFPQRGTDEPLGGENRRDVYRTARSPQADTYRFRKGGESTKVVSCAKTTPQPLRPYDKKEFPSLNESMTKPKSKLRGDYSLSTSVAGATLTHSRSLRARSRPMTLKDVLPGSPRRSNGAKGVKQQSRSGNLGGPENDSTSAPKESNPDTQILDDATAGIMNSIGDVSIAPVEDPCCNASYPVPCSS